MNKPARRAVVWFGAWLAFWLAISTGAAAQPQDEEDTDAAETTVGTDTEEDSGETSESNGDEGGGGDAPSDPSLAGLSNSIQILGLSQENQRVVLDIAVPAAIGGLAPNSSNFGITDAGRLVDFSIRPIQTPIDVVVVLDTSGSMRGEALAAAKAAATTFVEQLPSSTEVGLVTFGETVTVHQWPGPDRNAVTDEINALSVAGETALWDALIEAADLVERSEQAFIVVLSDGDDTASSASQADAVAGLQNGSASLYAVAIESPDTDLVALEEATGGVGGQFFDTTDIGQLQAVYTDIAGRLSNRYRLAYETNREYSRQVIVSVAIDGAVATVRTEVGSGQAPDANDAGQVTPPVINVPDGSRLGGVQAPEPGLLGAESSLLIGTGMVFAAMAIFGFFVLVPWSRGVQLRPAFAADQVQGMNARFNAAAERFMARRGGDGRLDKLLDVGGLALRPGEFILMSLMVVAGAALFGGLLGGLGLALIMVLLALLILPAYVSLRASRQRNKFANQLVTTLSIIVGGLRAGRGLPQAIEMVAQEAPEPTASQFRRVLFETRVGRDLTESIVDVADRMKSHDLDWIARAVDINRELGGDLTETLERVSETIRDRRRVARQVQALSAEGRASGWLMMAMPPLMFLFQLWRAPENAMTLIEEPVGRMLLGIAVFGIVIGFIWIQRLLKLKY